MSTKEKKLLKEISFDIKVALYKTSMNEEDKDILNRAKSKLDSLLKNK